MTSSKTKPVSPRKEQPSAEESPQRKTRNGAKTKKGSSKPEKIVLPDGTEMPVGMPPGMDPEMASQVIAFMRDNPAAAQQSLQTAQRMLQTPGMASHFLEAQRKVANSTPEAKERILALKGDPELKDMFEDIEKNGMGAMEKYWNDTELMSLVSAKLGKMNMGPTAPPRRRTPQGQAKSLREAAKVGDAQAAKALLAAGEDVNELDERGISPLGTAVGFNRLEVVQLLLDAGADVVARDKRGNTVLHYAAGYGRKEAAIMLLDKGAEMGARNLDGQTPADVAALNRETHMVRFLEVRAVPGQKFL